MTETNVTIPFEHYDELRTLAEDQPPISLSDRAIGTAHVAIVCAIFAGAVTAGTYGWAKVMDRYEERKFQRDMKKRQTT